MLQSWDPYQGHLVCRPLQLLLYIFCMVTVSLSMEKFCMIPVLWLKPLDMNKCVDAHTNNKWPQEKFDPVVSFMSWCIQIHVLTALKINLQNNKIIKREETISTGSLICSFLSAVMDFITFIVFEQTSMGGSICWWQAWSQSIVFDLIDYSVMEPWRLPLIDLVKPGLKKKKKGFLGTTYVFWHYSKYGSQWCMRRNTLKKKKISGVGVEEIMRSLEGW